MSALQITVIIASVLFILLVCSQVASKRLLLRYSLLWIVLAFCTILAAVFPGPVFCLSGFFGFVNPSNFIFFAALFFLMAITLSLSVVVSRQAIKLKNTIQNLALLEKRYEEDIASLGKLDEEANDCLMGKGE